MSTASAPGHPSVTVLVLPDITSPGELEDLLLASVHNDPAMPCVEAFLQCIDKEVPGRSPLDAKSKLYSYIASSDDPRLRVGEAVDHDLFPLDSPAFEATRQFLALLNMSGSAPTVSQ